MKERATGGASATSLEDMLARLEVLIGRLESVIAHSQAMLTSDVPEYLTTAQASKLLQVSEAELRSLTISGVVPGLFIGKGWRYQRAGIATWFTEEAAAAAGQRARPGPAMGDDRRHDGPLGHAKLLQRARDVTGRSPAKTRSPRHLQENAETV